MPQEYDDSQTYAPLPAETSYCGANLFFRAALTATGLRGAVIMVAAFTASDDVDPDRLFALATGGGQTWTEMADALRRHAHDHRRLAACIEGIAAQANGPKPVPAAPRAPAAARRPPERPSRLTRTS